MIIKFQYKITFIHYNTYTHHTEHTDVYYNNVVIFVVISYSPFVVVSLPPPIPPCHLSPAIVTVTCVVV